MRKVLSEIKNSRYRYFIYYSPIAMATFISYERNFPTASEAGLMIAAAKTPALPRPLYSIMLAPAALMQGFGPMNTETTS
jgi:hypothetical protein